MDNFFLIQIISNSILIGVLIITQIISYPSLSSIDKTYFEKYHKNYVNRISYVVIPLMLIELFSLVYLTFYISDLFMIKSLLILLTIWLFTFICIIPLHNSLSNKRSDDVINRLINYNWFRTILWSIKLIIILFVYI